MDGWNVSNFDSLTDRGHESTMASAAPLKDIDEQFLQCCICLDRLKEPKILQCLHRHCRDCLKKITKEGDKKVQCPTCRDEHTLPKGGVDGLKTDFNTKNIVEFIQLQESVEKDPLKECAGCDKKLRVSAYCFRCNDFLCQGCHEYHRTSKILEDHRSHVFSLSDAGARNLTIEKLSSLKDAPRCHNHPEKLSELVCTSCGNLPICVPCTYGEHEGHELKEVSSLAKVERGRLEAKMSDLEQYKGKILKVQEEIKKAKDRLHQTVDEKRSELRGRLRAEEENIRRKIQETDEDLNKRKAELGEKTRRKTWTRKQELEKELAEARTRYERFCEEERQEADAGLKKLQQEIDSEKTRLQEGLDTMNRSIKEQLASLETQQERNTKKIKDLADHYDGIMKRFQTVTMTASSILAAKHDWTDVQCIPDVCRAIDPLIQDAQRESPDLGTLAGVDIRGLTSGGRGRVEISEEPESVDIVSLKREGWYIRDITSNKDGDIIITGPAGIGTHITVINRKGELQRQHIVKKRSDRSGCCDLLSDHEVVVVVGSSGLGIYNITENVYTERDISDSVTWPEYLWISSVSVDHDHRHIIVGCRTQKEVYVLNSELGYIRTLTLPSRPGWGPIITVHGGNLLICDPRYGGQAYAATMEGPVCRMLYELPPPGGGWMPWDVCTDSNHYIYILWRNRMEEGQVIAQYSPDGGQLLAKRPLDEVHYGRCITTVDTEEGEKLAVATLRTRKLIIYGLE